MTRYRIPVLILTALLAGGCSADSPESSLVAPDEAAFSKGSPKAGKGGIEVKAATTGADLDRLPAGR